MLTNLLGQNQTKTTYCVPGPKMYNRVFKTIPAQHMVKNFSGLQAQLIYHFHLVSPQG